MSARRIVLVAGLLCAMLESAPRVMAEPAVGIKNGDTVAIEYTLIVDGKVEDTDTGSEPFSFVQGAKQIVPGLERQMAGLKAGDERDFTVSPEEGYGQVDTKGTMEVPRDRLPKHPDPAVGMILQAKASTGEQVLARIVDVKPNTIIVDFNHPLAGKTLHFHVKVLSVTPKPA